MDEVVIQKGGEEFLPDFFASSLFSWAVPLFRQFCQFFGSNVVNFDIWASRPLVIVFGAHLVCWKRFADSRCVMEDMFL
jgi:hypothetical protein